MSNPSQKGGPVAPANGGKLPPLSEDTVRQLVAQQAQEQSLRSQELAIRKQELDYQSKHASEIIGAQVHDRDLARSHSRCLERNKMIFFGVIVALLVGFSCWGLYMDKEAVVRDVIQIMLSGLVGAFGGYGYAKATPKASTETPEDD